MSGYIVERDKAVYFLGELRRARSAALKDAEAFSEVLFVLERLGSLLIGEIADLGKYEPRLADLAGVSPLAEEIPQYYPACHTPFCFLYRLVKDARNDAAHQGAFARHLTENAAVLALVLEDALMQNSHSVRDFMVTDPICAETWQPLSLIRQKMLLNSFSYLPVYWPKGGWKLVSDRSLSRYLRGFQNQADSTKERKRRLAQKLMEAVESGEIALEPASLCRPDTPVSDVAAKLEGTPVLVVDSQDPPRLLGIVTAFDLL